MPDIDLHPTIREFKQFINHHPELIREIRKNGRGWQEYYEKWLLLGEDDPMWEQFKQKTNNIEKTTADHTKTDWFNQILKIAEKVDINKVQEQVNQLSTAVSSIQEMLSHSQAKGHQAPGTGKNERPFRWFKD